MSVCRAAITMATCCVPWCPCGLRFWRRPRRQGQTGSRGKGSRWRILRSWLSRFPVASTLAFFMCSIAISSLGISLYEAVEYLVVLLELKIVKTVVLAVVAAHLFVASYFLLVAILSTGRTREELTAASSRVNLMGRCVQMGCICTAYVLHLVWLFLPAVLLLPLGILVGLCALCRVMPSCITLSDYGISPDLVDKYSPDMIVDKIRNFNESILLDYADQTGEFLLTTIDNVETSPLLEQLISQIEMHIPDEEQADRFITDLLQYIDLDQLAGVLEKAETGVGYLDQLVELLGRVPKMTGYVDMLTRNRPDIDGVVKKHMDNVANYSREGFNTIENWANQTVNLTHHTSDLRDSMKEQLNKGEILSPTPIERMPAYVNGTSASNITMMNAVYNSSNIDTSLASNILPNGTSHVNQDVKDSIHQDVALPNGTFQETVDNLGEEGKEVVEDMYEGAQEAAGDMSDHVDKTVDKAADLVEDAQKETQKIIADARKLAEDAQQVAQRAAKEAEVAVRRAEDLARAVVQEVDERARELAITAAEKAKEAARQAQKAAADAIKRAKAAVNEAESIIRGVARGAISWARKAMTKVRYYAKSAFAWARKAVKEAKKGARVAVKYIGIAKREFLKGYEYAKEFYYKLKIERIGKDTFCSEIKVFFCQEGITSRLQIYKSTICMAIVFISSIVINLSMVHFLMAMTANYVHLKAELARQRRRSRLAEGRLFGGPLTAGESPLLFTTTDTGSLQLATTNLSEN